MALSFFSFNELTPEGDSAVASTREDGAMAVIAFLVFFSNVMFPPLLPELAREFHEGPLELKWLVQGFSLVYAAATLVYGIMADRLGRIVLLKRLLCLAALAVTTLSFAMTAGQLVLLRALSGLGTGGIVTISLSIIGDKYPYAVQGRPMGKMFGAIAAGMGLGVSLGPMLSALIWDVATNEWTPRINWHRIICPGPFFCGLTRGMRRGDWSARFKLYQ